MIDESVVDVDANLQAETIDSVDGEALIDNEKLIGDETIMDETDPNESDE